VNVNGDLYSVIYELWGNWVRGGQRPSEEALYSPYTVTHRDGRKRSIFFTRPRFTVITPRGKCEEYNAHENYFRRSDGLGYLFRDVTERSPQP